MVSIYVSDYKHHAMPLIIVEINALENRPRREIWT